MSPYLKKGRLSDDAEKDIRGHGRGCRDRVDCSARRFAQAEATPTLATPIADTRLQSGYAPVNGPRMYYEIYGSGEPLVLLHGAFGAIDPWGPMLTILAENHQVIAVEFQGHGHTADWRCGG